MDTKKLLIVSTIALLPLAGALAADREPREGTDATSAAVAALKANLGNTASFEVDEVRVTQAGVACIDYRVSDGKGGKSPGHAVVQGDEVLKSSSEYERFEKVWNAHCLGPRGGISGGE
jgi:hypothetical protein